MHTDDPVLDLMDRFTVALNSHDLDAIVALVTDDIVFESTSPPPDGTRYEGGDAVRQIWGEMLAATPQAGFPSRSSSRAAQDAPSCADATTGRTGTCVAWILSGSEMASSPKAWPTSRANGASPQPNELCSNLILEQNLTHASHLRMAKVPSATQQQIGAPCRPRLVPRARSTAVMVLVTGRRVLGAAPMSPQQAETGFNKADPGRPPPGPQSPAATCWPSPCTG